MTTPTALVVENSHAPVLLHEVLMKKNGFTVTVTRNSQQAVDLVSSGKEFDVILLNKYMPIMNGVVTTKKLRSMNVKSLIVGVTVDEEEEERLAFLKSGLDYCFEAPMNIAKATKIVELFNNANSTDNM